MRQENEKNINESATPSPSASHVRASTRRLGIDMATLWNDLCSVSTCENKSKNANTQKLAPSNGAPRPEKYTSHDIAPRPLIKTATDVLLMKEPAAYIQTAKKPRTSSAVSADDDEKEKCDGSIFVL